MITEQDAKSAAQDIQQGAYADNEDGVEEWHSDIQTCACWITQELGQRETSDTTGEPAGWTIVSIAQDGSMLCQSPEGHRRRYWLESGKRPAPVCQAYGCDNEADETGYCEDCFGG